MPLEIDLGSTCKCLIEQCCNLNVEGTFRITGDFPVQNAASDDMPIWHNVAALDPTRDPAAERSVAASEIYLSYLRRASYQGSNVG